MSAFTSYSNNKFESYQRQELGIVMLPTYSCQCYLICEQHEEHMYFHNSYISIHSLIKSDKFVSRVCFLSRTPASSNFRHLANSCYDDDSSIMISRHIRNTKVDVKNEYNSYTSYLRVRRGQDKDPSDQPQLFSFGTIQENRVSCNVTALQKRDSLVSIQKSV
jgi:hypothetical protein